jgi:DnaK suppressor protein
LGEEVSVGDQERIRHLKPLGGIEAIRERLEQHRGEILELYEQDVRAGQAAADEGSDDIVDRANNAYSRELLFSLSDGERITLLHIERALQRIEGGTYGVCSHCQRTIPVERLKAVPWAHYCIDCQELAEKGMLEER